MLASTSAPTSCRTPAASQSLKSLQQIIPRIRHLSSRPQHAVASASAQDRHRSFDSEDELDAGLAAELSSTANPAKAQQAATHLDLLWKIGKRRRPEACNCCAGAGNRECHWCHGTGVLTVGDSIVSSTSTQRSTCPVCKGEGYNPCQHCRGTGYRAQWLGGSTSCDVK